MFSSPTLIIYTLASLPAWSFSTECIRYQRILVVFIVRVLIYTHSSVVVKFAPIGTRTQNFHSRVRRFAGLSIPGRAGTLILCRAVYPYLSVHCAYFIALSIPFHSNLSVHSEEYLQRDRDEEEIEATIGQLSVAVVSGDLLCETTDAILNPTDAFLSLSGNVSTKITQAGGHSIQDECNALKSTHHYRLKLLRVYVLRL